MKHVLICGTSTRAAADSAARAGFRVTAIDAYADRDQHQSVRAVSASRSPGLPAHAAALARAARAIDCDAVAYLSPFENHPHAVTALRSGRTLWGNTPQTLVRVRDPRVLAAALRRLGCAAPRLLHDSNDLNDLNDPNDSNDWLVKPLRSGGGRSIRPWRGEGVARTSYVQQRIQGTPGSVVFVASRGACVPLGVSRQLVGDANFGAAGYRYCGSIIARPDDPQFAHGPELAERAFGLAARVAGDFGLVGLNGIDFIGRDGIPYPVEVNPRWSASMEVVERLSERPLFQLHADACDGRTLSSSEVCVRPWRQKAFGRAVVYARESGRVGDTDSWLADATVRDVPRSGEYFRSGQPVCTVLAAADDGSGCYRALVDRAARIYAEMNRVREVEFSP